MSDGETGLQLGEITREIRRPVELDPREYLAVALDVPDAESALRLVDAIGDGCRWLKVGMELFYAAGGAIVEELRARGYKIFLDLKLHDIPNTVATAVQSLRRWDAQILTLHAAGGPQMLGAAIRAAASGTGMQPMLAGVTVLTSMDDEQLAQTGVASGSEEQVLRLARMGIAAGLNAFVASPLELWALRRELGQAPYLIVPGVRPSGSAQDDQRRTATPGGAIADGASLLVVGRPITRASDPVAATQAILEEIARSVPYR